MPRKGMRSLCFHTKTTSLSLASPASTPSRRSISEVATDHIIESAAVLIAKWDPEASAYAKVTSLFYESKAEAQLFIRRVGDLQRAMHFLMAEDSSSEKLVFAQSLMQSAMKRLQKEFYQILSTNRAYLDPECVSTRSSRASARSSTSDFDDDDTATDDDVRTAGESISEVEQVSSTAMEELRLIAECMISAGYAKECINIYKIIRKSIIDEGIYRMGVEKLSSSHVNKTDWEVLDLRIKSWLGAVKIAMRTLFNGERILCDHVFSASDSIRESCFADISREGALLLFGFPEALVTKAKKSSEKMFRVLDMYTAIFENWPEIEAIFSFESTAVVRTQAYNSLVRIAEFVRAALADFEAKLQKESSKLSSAVSERGGGVHRLTVRSMNYLSLLADYSNVLADIFRDAPPPQSSSLPESFFDAGAGAGGGSDESEDSQSFPAPAISLRVAWLVLVLLCKLDGKAKRYDDVSVSYLFLANNLQHVVNKVRTSNLHYLLGEDWSDKHEAKVRQFAANYERLAWGNAIAALPEDPAAEVAPEEAKAVFRNFNARFEEAYRKQRSSVVSDPKLRDEIKASLARKLVSAYKEFYDTNRARVGNEKHHSHNRVFFKFTPEDVGNYLSDLFFGTTPTEDLEMLSSSSSSSSAPSSPMPSPTSSDRRRNWRIR